ncbi:MAG: DUF393 domain-containing protein [Gammaproteobacteria bacterium]|nr:DUF393 domain-containing protein [Gammaproteobacteria bacterium]
MYFDGACPLCAGEIEQLRRRRGDALALVDIHSLADGPEDARGADRAETVSASASGRVQGESLPTKDTLLRTLHLRRAGGDWLVGADANVAAWEGTGQERLWRVLRAPLLRHVVDVFYDLWARWRYRRLYGNGERNPAGAPRTS